jgi:hypothetical protein
VTRPLRDGNGSDKLRIMSHGRLRAALWVAAAASVALSLALATQSLVVGSVSGKAVYGYVQGFTAQVLIVGLLASAAAASLIRLAPPAPGRNEWLLLAAWLLVALGLQAFIRSLTLFSMESIFVSDGANSFYSVAAQHDPVWILDNFSRLRREAPLHAQSSMPGKILLIQALQLVSARTDVLPWLIVVVSNLGGLLMYTFVRDLSADRTTALYAMVLYLFVPGKLVFLPLMNTVTPVIVLACAVLLMRWLRTGSAWLAAALGIACYALAFFEPLPLVMGLLFAALALHAVWCGGLTAHRAVLHAALAALALMATSELVRLVFGFEIVRTFRQLGAHAVQFNTVEGRPYAIWVLANLQQLAIASGICQAALFAAVLGGVVSVMVRNPSAARTQLSDPMIVLCLGLFGVVLVTDLLGINRGEVVRLWIFLACCIQIPAAFVCARLPQPSGIAVVLVTSILLASIGTRMLGFIVP